MGLKGLIIVFLIILLLIPFSVAKTEYPNIGGVDGDYNNGEGFFGASANFLTRGIGVSSDTQVPLVLDLDGDNSIEIVIIDGTSIRILNSTLATKDTLSLPLTGTVSNMITFDIDGDGRDELIVAGEDTELIIFVDWNGTDLTLQNSLNYSNREFHANPDVTGIDGGQIQIACDSVQSCQLHISSTRKRAIPNRGNLSIVLFNESQIHNFTTYRINPASSDTYCSPHVKNVEVVDIDADGQKEYISSWLEQSSAGTTNVITVAVDNNGDLKSGFPIIDNDVSATGANDCEDGIGRLISPPTVFPFLGGTEGASDSQVAQALMLSGGNTFKIKLYTSTGDFIDDFPETIDGEGRLISTVMRGNFFPDTQDVDFCTAGFDTVSTQLEVVCGSLLSGEFPDANRYIINLTGKFVIDQNVFENWDVIGHSTNHENTQSQCLDVSCSANDLDEVLTSYGIFRLDRTGFICDFFGTCFLKEVFANPFNTTGVFLSVDVTQSGAEDLMLMTDTNLFLFDALFQDQPPVIDRKSIIINPCISENDIETVWKQNTTVSIAFAVDDTDPVSLADLDQVFGQVEFYADSPDEQIADVQGASASGTTFFFGDTFQVNKTGNGIIRLLGNDTGSDAQDIVNIPFSVGSNGVEFNDCQTIGFGVVPEVPLGVFNISASAQANEGIIGGFETLADIVGFNLTILWLLLMLISVPVIIVGFTQLDKQNDSQTNPVIIFGAIIVVQILLLVIGTILGFIPLGILLTIVVLGLILLGLALRRMFAQETSGGVM